MTKEKNECVPRLRFPEFAEEEWTSVPLGENATIRQERAKNNKCILLSVSSGVGLISQKEKFGREIAGNQLSRYFLVYKNDFVYNKSATKLYPQGFIAAYTKDQLAAVPSSIFICFFVNKNINIYFLNYLFKFNIHGKWLKKFITVGARAHGSLNIDNKDILSIPIPLPYGKNSLAEQQKIADCLSSLDELIEAREQKCNALKQHKKGLMQRLFPAEGENMPRWRFPEFRDSGEWNLLTLASICHLQAGKFIAAEKIHTVWHEGLFPCYGGNGLRGYVEESNCKKCYPLIGRQGALCGNIQMPDREFYATEHAIIAKCDESLSNNIFLFYILSKLNLNSLAIGQAQPGISVEILKKVLIQHPSLPEQQKIADCLSSLDDRIAAEEERLAALREHKKGLMQQLFPRYE